MNEVADASNSITNFISANVGEAGLQAALEGLTSIRKVLRVYKGQVDAQGGCTFTIYFDPASTPGDIPLLVVASNTFGYKWTGDVAGSVVIRTQQHGKVGKPIYAFSYTVGSLIPYTRYSFRVKGVMHDHETDWSVASKYIRTLSSVRRFVAPPSSSMLHSTVMVMILYYFSVRFNS